MDIKEKIALIKRNTVEVVTDAELEKLLKEKKQPVTYCGYEPSGPIHLGNLVTFTKLMDLQKAGFKVIILLADMHAYLNKKGDFKHIEKEMNHWTKGIKALGLKAEVIKGTSFQFKKEYWTDIMDMSVKTTITKGLKSMQEQARDIENATISQILYPLMQIEDIKVLGVDVAQGGIEQRKIHMLSRELLPDVNYKAPICIHTPLITSLKGPGSKMSKSIPGSGISVIDTEEEIKQAIKNAYCPEKVIEDNPILQITRLIIFPHLSTLAVDRPAKFGGTLKFKSYEDVEEAYKEGKLHPMDLKSAVAMSLEKIIKPIRAYFKK
mgnify:CR=1 FL=1